ncbi:unnamed protein product, partial [Ceratitis capitata]
MIRRGWTTSFYDVVSFVNNSWSTCTRKIESERLRTSRYNKQKLRGEEYIHLRDANNNNATSPNWYVGSPRH